MGNEIKRKLVTIRQVKDIKPIEGADLIELCIVDGWQVVSKKGDFKSGNKCVYYEIDSYLPIEDRYEFLRKSSYKKYSDGSKEGFRLKTIRLRGQISQGLIIPLDKFPELTSDEIGTDLTDLLNVLVYDPPLPASLSGMAKGLFPSFIKKTDQERIQNLPDYLEKSDFKDMKFEVTIKLDGSSVTIYQKDGEAGVCSRNLEFKDDDTSTYSEVARVLKIKEKLINHGKNIALQGELIGTGIQKNNEKITGQDIYIFDIFDIDNQRYLLPSERQKLVAELGLKHVPVLYSNYEVFKEHDSIESILKMAEGTSMNPNSIREGLVFKSESLYRGNTVSFKAINNEYLLKNE